jgi:hypothetical protein
LLVIPARRFSTAEGLVKQESSAFAFNGLQALDPGLTSPPAVESRWDDERSPSLPPYGITGGT